MEIKITKGLPLFSGRPEFSVEQLKKEVVFVEFPNCISTTTGNSFKWCPTYFQLKQIKIALDEIEKESWAQVGCDKK